MEKSGCNRLGGECALVLCLQIVMELYIVLNIPSCFILFRFIFKVDELLQEPNHEISFAHFLRTIYFLDLNCILFNSFLPS